MKDFKFRDYGKEWFNNEILDLIYQRRAAVLEFQDTGDPELFQLAKDLRDRISAKVTAAKAT